MQIIKIDGDWSLTSIVAVRAAAALALQDKTKGSGDVALDCSGVTGCDVSGVQLLASLLRSFAVSSRSLRVCELSPVMARSLARAGLSLSPSNDALVCGGN
jgi:anti-anti-sigma regulatory factor